MVDSAASARQLQARATSEDIETPSEAGSTSFLNAHASSCFPFEAFRCLPPMVLAFIPRTWQKIQDGTHLILVMGAMACTIMCVQTLVSLINQGCLKLDCGTELLILFFIVPCTVYCIRIIGQYDDRLISKQMDCKEQKANLTKSYNTLLSDMDGLLTKSAESSAGLAERSFESKRRDFQRFLERVKSKHSSYYSGAQGDADKLLAQFRRFCASWLLVFEECSIDPLNNPKRVVTEEEMNRCTSMLEIADLCLDRLRVTEVRFISIQRDQDAQMLRKNRNEMKRLTNAMPGVAPPPPVEIPSPQREAGGRRASWFQLGPGHGLGVNTAGEAGEPFPKEVKFGCGRLVVLSSEHLMLLLGFVVGLALLIFQAWDVAYALASKAGGKRTSWIPVSIYISIAQLLIAELCVFTMLLKFEEIDIVQQLEREVRELHKQNERVGQQRERMRGFWNNVQQLTELWLYRTVPRLDLYKEIHSQLEDTNEDLLMKISSVNQSLEDLEARLGNLQAWRNDGTVTIEEKKGFGKAVNALCQEQELDEVLVKLEELTSTGMQSLAPPTPTHSNAAA